MIVWIGFDKCEKGHFSVSIAVRKYKCALPIFASLGGMKKAGLIKVEKFDISKTGKNSGCYFIIL